ncbi:cathepsin L [Clonorchis sinensis]|uniref:Cathepsin L n=1 Tax=Clonorchis sinensis TaxID=79923 RepID=G7YUN6_CLOSI|nr:cathepsin L [Clonorchis sinensis]
MSYDFVHIPLILALFVYGIVSELYEWDILINANTKMGLILEGNASRCMESLNEHLNYTMHIAWKQFKHEFNRNYSNSKEVAKRMNLFCNSFLIVRKHNMAYNKDKELYNLGINEFSDKVSDCIRSIFRLLQTSEESSHTCISDLQLPDTTEFASTYRMISAEPLKTYRLESVWCSHTSQTSGGLWMLLGFRQSWVDRVALFFAQAISLHTVTATGCHGGYLPWGYRYINQTGGLERELNYPYVAGGTGQPNPKCLFDKRKMAAKIVGLNAVPFYNEKAITQAVGFFGLVAILINASPETFRRYRGVFFMVHVTGIVAFFHLLLGNTSDVTKGATEAILPHRLIAGITQGPTKRSDVVW